MTERITAADGTEWPVTGTTCGVCGWPTDPVLAGGPHMGCEPPDPILALPGVMRAVSWLVCRGCDRRIEVGDPMGLRERPDGRAWVCRGCLAPELDAEVPAPRGERVEVVP